jgi:hypothetical protein
MARFFHYDNAMFRGLPAILAAAATTTALSLASSTPH